MSIFRRFHKKKLPGSSKGKTGDSAAFEALVEELSKGSPQAVDALINFAKKEIPVKGEYWKRILELSESSHTDFNTGESSLKCDYHHTDTLHHTDTGIGLEIPPELKAKLQP